MGDLLDLMSSILPGLSNDKENRYKYYLIVHVCSNSGSIYRLFKSYNKREIVLFQCHMLIDSLKHLRHLPLLGVLFEGQKLKQVGHSISKLSFSMFGCLNTL